MTTAARFESDLTSEIEAEVRKSLHVTQHAALRHITCSVHDNTAVLQGRVPSYYLKQLAQVKVTCVPGIEQVDNRIEVFISRSNS